MNQSYKELQAKQRRMTRIAVVLISIQVIVSTAIIVYFATQGV